MGDGNDLNIRARHAIDHQVRKAPHRHAAGQSVPDGTKYGIELNQTCRALDLGAELARNGRAGTFGVPTGRVREFGGGFRMEDDHQRIEALTLEKTSAALKVSISPASSAAMC